MLDYIRALLEWYFACVGELDCGYYITVLRPNEVATVLLGAPVAVVCFFMLEKLAYCSRHHRLRVECERSAERLSAVRRGLMKMSFIAFPAAWLVPPMWTAWSPLLVGVGTGLVLSYVFGFVYWMFEETIDGETIPQSQNHRVQRVAPPPPWPQLTPPQPQLELPVKLKTEHPLETQSQQEPMAEEERLGKGEDQQGTESRTEGQSADTRPDGGQKETVGGNATNVGEQKAIKPRQGLVLTAAELEDPERSRKRRLFTWFKDYPYTTRLILKDAIGEPTISPKSMTLFVAKLKKEGIIVTYPLAGEVKGLYGRGTEAISLTDDGIRQAKEQFGIEIRRSARTAKRIKRDTQVEHDLRVQLVRIDAWGAGLPLVEAWKIPTDRVEEGVKVPDSVLDYPYPWGRWDQPERFFKVGLEVEVSLKSEKRYKTEVFPRCQAALELKRVDMFVWVCTTTAIADKIVAYFGEVFKELRKQGRSEQDLLRLSRRLRITTIEEWPAMPPPLPLPVDNGGRK